MSNNTGHPLAHHQHKLDDATADKPAQEDDYQPPNQLHTKVEKMKGSLETKLGRLTNDPTKILKGEDRMAKAEAKEGIAVVRHVNQVKDDLTSQ
ncbi:hypothetical protein HK097_000363 [Rhizophlyctis rosea]|uniref:CsbD family protein n=1 Tax=Rhizophlyctis rosea TaxID=64517 RepID=A0AAD5SDP8_9FUNG|nr:hypothetical protein HK097_000363 [Rhizophlyctis rosea]